MGNLETLAIEQMILEKEQDMEAAAKEAVRAGKAWWFLGGMVAAFIAIEALLVTAMLLASVMG